MQVSTRRTVPSPYGPYHWSALFRCVPRSCMSGFRYAISWTLRSVTIFTWNITQSLNFHVLFTASSARHICAFAVKTHTETCLQFRCAVAQGQWVQVRIASCISAMTHRRECILMAYCTLGAKCYALAEVRGAAGCSSRMEGENGTTPCQLSQSTKQLRFNLCEGRTAADEWGMLTATIGRFRPRHALVAISRRHRLTNSIPFSCSRRFGGRSLRQRVTKWDRRRWWRCSETDIVDTHAMTLIAKKWQKVTEKYFSSSTVTVPTPPASCRRYISTDDLFRYWFRFYTKEENYCFSVWLLHVLRCLSYITSSLHQICFDNM